MGTKMKKMVSLFLGLILALSLAACNSAAEGTADSGTKTNDSETQANDSETKSDGIQVSGAAASGKTQVADESDMAEEVTVILPTDTATLAPFEGSNGGRSYMLNTFYEYLGIMDSRGEDVTLVLAKSYTKVEPLVYEIEIYDYIYDTAGNHITAADIAYCYNICLEKSSFQALVSLDTVEVVDEYTLHFILNAETMGVLTNILQAVPIISQTAYENSDDGMVANPIGTTGYVCTSFTAGSGLTCEYQGTWQDPELICNSFARNVRIINYVYIAEASQMRIALETGEADLCFSLPSTDLQQFSTGASSDVYDIYKGSESKVIRILFNGSDDNSCSDTALRQAISYAIDRESINTIVYGGAGILPNSLCSVLLSDYNADWDADGYYDYSIENAMEKLEESNYNGETIRILTSSTWNLKTMAELVATYLETIGIKAEVLTYEDSQAESLAADPSAWELYICQKGSEDYMVNDWMRWVPASTYNGVTQSFIDDEQLQTYYKEMADVNTYSIEIVNEAHQYLEDMCYGYALMQAPSYAVYNNSLISEIVISYKGYPLANGFNYISD